MKINLPDKFYPRLVMTSAGVILCAVAVGFFKCSLFGVDPFQCFAQGSWQRFMGNFSYGTYYAGLSLIMMVVCFAVTVTWQNTAIYDAGCGFSFG